MASDAFKRFGISKEQLEEMIRAEAEVDSEMNDFMEKEIVPYAKSIAPVNSGEYAAKIKVTKKAKRGKGKVAATAWYSHFIEYGTKADDGPATMRARTKNGWRTVRNLPTAAQAVMAQTAAHFGGKTGADGGIEYDGGEDE